MRQVTRVLLSLLVVASLAAACGGDDSDSDVVAGDGGSNTDASAGDPDTAVSSPPATDDDGSDPGATWTRIEPTEDLLDPVLATPDEIVADPDDPNAVLIHFYGGVQECYGARAAVMEETDTEVTIRLEVGNQPDAGDTACIEIAEAQELQLVLDAPVGDRTLTAAT